MTGETEPRGLTALKAILAAGILSTAIHYTHNFVDVSRYPGPRYLYTPTRLRGAAVGLLALLRNEGGSFGTSMAQTFEERREQFHTLRLGEHLDRTSAGANAFLERAQAMFLQHSGDPAGAARMAKQQLSNLRQQQAASLAYFDVFWISAVMAVGLVLAVLLMKRSVAEKGAHVGAFAAEVARVLSEQAADRRARTRDRPPEPGACPWHASTATRTSPGARRCPGRRA